MRVLQLSKTSTGASWAFKQMRDLVKHGLEVHVAMPLGGTRVADYEKAGIHIHPQSFGLAPHNMLIQGWNLRRLVKKIQPDIIHSWFAQTTLYSRIFLRDIPIPRIFQVPGPLHLETPLYRWADILSAGKRDHWIGTSEFINNLYRGSGVKERDLSLSYSATDLEFYEPKEPGYLREKYAIPEDKKIIGLVSHIYPPHKMLLNKRGFKGHEDLIDAFSILLQKRDDLVLVIVGKAWDDHVWYENQIIEYGRSKCGDNVIFTGYMDDVRDAFADFDVFVYPSHSENLGGVFESLLLKVPTVASAVGGIPEAVLDGETGLLIDPNNHQQIADAIEKILANPTMAQKFVEKGEKHIRSLLDIKHSVPEVIKIYEALLTQSQTQ